MNRWKIGKKVFTNARELIEWIIDYMGAVNALPNPDGWFKDYCIPLYKSELKLLEDEYGHSNIEYIGANMYFRCSKWGASMLLWSVDF